MKKTIKKEKNNETNPTQISLAGEFAVLSQLFLRGYDANMTLGNTKGVDILASNPKTDEMFRIEVKTNHRNIKDKPSNSKIHGKTWGYWIMNKNHEEIKDPKLFYCFINANKKTGEFRFFIVPSLVVAKYVKDQHNLFLKKKKEEGKKVKNTSMRLFRIGLKKENYEIGTPSAEQYENNWNFLK